jgi:hypothetical protein
MVKRVRCTYAYIKSESFLTHLTVPDVFTISPATSPPVEGIFAFMCAFSTGGKVGGGNHKNTKYRWMWEG